MLERYYQALDVDENASLAEIKHAYRLKAKEYHPDLNPSPEAHQKFIEINESYLILCRVKTGVYYPNTGTNNRRRREERNPDWLVRERAKARARAAYYAKMRYEEFKKTSTYKASRILYSVFDFIYIFIGLIMIISPVVYSIVVGFDSQDRARSIATLVSGIIMGSTFVIMIVFSRSELSERIYILYKKLRNITKIRK